MIDFLTGANVGSMISGAFSIIGGVTQYKGAKRIAKVQSAMNEMHRKWNIEEAEKAFKENYANVMSQYSTQRLLIEDDYRQNRTNINMQLQQLQGQGVDINESSAKDSMLNQLQYEYMDAIQNYTLNIVGTNNQIAKQYLSQKFQINNSAIENDFQIRQNKINTQHEAMGKVINGAFSMVGSGLDMWNNARSNAQNTNNVNMQIGISSPSSVYNMDSKPYSYRPDDRFLPNPNTNLRYKTQF